MQISTIFGVYINLLTVIVTQSCNCVMNGEFKLYNCYNLFLI